MEMRRRRRRRRRVQKKYAMRNKLMRQGKEKE